MYKNNRLFVVVLYAFICFVPFKLLYAWDGYCGEGYYNDNNASAQCESCDSATFKSLYRGFSCPAQPQNKRRPIIPEQLTACDDSTIPTKTMSGCESGDKSATLKPGQFFDGKSIQQCDETLDQTIKPYLMSNYYFETIGTNKIDSSNHVTSRMLQCPGAQITYSSDTSRNYLKGLRLCPKGTLAWAETNHTECEPEPVNNEVKCKQGEYIPANHRSCRSCSELKGDEVGGCQGGFSVDLGKLPKNANLFYEGAKRNTTTVTGKCPSGLRFRESERIYCTNECSKGLPDNPNVCDPNSFNTSSSNSNNVKINADLAGKFNPNSLNNIKTPTINANLKLTDVTCAKGEVWANQGCVKCNANNAYIEYFTNVRSYCPGGSWPMGTLWTAQIKKCPEGQWPTGDMSKCECGWAKHKKPDGTCTKNMTFDKDDLYYGPKGKSAPINKQCWTKNSADSYKLCMGFDN